MHCPVNALQKYRAILTNNPSINYGKTLLIPVIWGTNVGEIDTILVTFGNLPNEVLVRKAKTAVPIWKTAVSITSSLPAKVRAN
jgi:hypothetical protein